MAIFSKAAHDNTVMARGSIPFYFLYGEANRDVDPRFVHVERVADRGNFHGGTVAEHSHPHLHQLSFWLSATGAYSADGNRHSLNGPMLTWIPSGVVHGFAVSPDCDCIVVSMSDDFVETCLRGMDAPAITAILRRPLLVAPPAELLTRFREGFEHVEREYQFPSWAQVQAIEAQVRLLFIALARLVERDAPSEPAQSNLFPNFLAALDQHFREHRTVDAYADLLGTTPYLLNRATMTGAGMHASHVIRTRILQEAKRLLLYTVLDVGEVGFNLGFEDAAHFGRLFTAAVGTPPGRWRAQQRHTSQTQLSQT